MEPTIGIFDLNNRNCILGSTWERHYREMETERLQPYADLLLDYVIWPDILARKDGIFADLKKKCSTAANVQQLSVPFFHFSHVSDYPRKPGMVVGSHAHTYALEGGDKDALRVQQIHDNGWRPWMVLQELEEDDDPEDYLNGSSLINSSLLISVIKKTDFCQQLAVRFGRNYWVTLEKSGFEVERDPSGDEFYRKKMALHLNYFPSGLTEYYQNKKDEFLDKLSARERRVLKQRERFVYWNGGANIFTCPPPPPPPSPARRGIFMPCSDGKGGTVLKDISRAF